jgi:hypothetical protein
MSIPTHADAKCGVQRLLIDRQTHAVDANKTQYGHFLQTSISVIAALQPLTIASTAGTYCTQMSMLSKVDSEWLSRSSSYDTLDAF